jgi:hypothetical protein
MIWKLQSEICLTTVAGSIAVSPAAYRPSITGIAAATGDATAAALAAVNFIVVGDAKSSLAQANSRLNASRQECQHRHRRG